MTSLSCKQQMLGPLVGRSDERIPVQPTGLRTLLARRASSHQAQQGATGKSSTPLMDVAQAIVNGSSSILSPRKGDTTRNQGSVFRLRCFGPHRSRGVFEQHRSRRRDTILCGIDAIAKPSRSTFGRRQTASRECLDIQAGA